MNNIDIEKIAKEYVFARFPKASIKEKNKIIKDWVMKEKDANLLVNDFKKRVGSTVSKKILDAGSGNGGISIAFANSGAIVSGVDIEKELYEISLFQKKSLNVSNVDFYHYDGVKLPFSDDHFNYALSLSVLEHTDNPVEYLKEILRVVKKDGFLYLGFPNKIWPKETHTGLWFLTYLPNFLKDIVVKIFNKNPLPENNLHFYSLADLIEFIKPVSADRYKWVMVKEDGETKNIFKIIIKKVLSFFGLSYKLFLPHVLVVLKKTSNE